MKQLRFTTSEPGFMGASGSALVEEKGKVTFTPTKHGTIYIDDEAERLAGYDIPKFLSGDTAQVDRPIKEQDIVMVIPSGEYPCIAEVYESPTGSQYHLHLKKKEEESLKEASENHANCLFDKQIDLEDWVQSKEDFKEGAKWAKKNNHV